MMQEMTQEQREVAERVAKILRLADRNPNANEAAAAAAKAQELLEAYNLTASQAEAAGGETGRREEQVVRGGHYDYQRDLWRAVCELNFCLYLPRQRPRQVRSGFKDANGEHVMRWTGGYQWHHFLVGRVVNVAAAVGMAQYLEGAVERLLRDRLSARGQDHKFYFSNWALSYREGAFGDIIKRLADRRQAVLDEEVARQREAAERAGASTATSLTLADVAQREQDANQDFLHGEGYSARQHARRADQAKRLQEQEEAYTRWAAEHPEEAAAKEAEERKERERYWARRRGGSYAAQGRDTDYSAYRAGQEAGASVSIDQQASHGAAGARRLR